ncbi:hypothetical protein [Algoriphagus taiwanensis]|uniref:Holin-X, holin superfamily III n=1 Tax=Algoriphagus taiwanensis TaxID=1445656 RepID=A0ABQ6Q2I4_9BACT|nr:hypothetical protein Ataiwa_26460 [Algoriphagus taiwanensis]
METNFNDIQQLWQSQKAKDFDIQGLISGLKKTEQKQRKERISIAIITPVTLAFLFIAMPWAESKAILFSLLVIAVAMLWVVWLSFKSTLMPSDNSESLSNQKYLETQLAKLRQRYKIAGTYMYYYALLLAIALNVSYYVLLAPFSLEMRIAVHLALTLIIMVMMNFSIKRRLKKYDRTIKPIMEELERLLSDIKKKEVISN